MSPRTVDWTAFPGSRDLPADADGLRERKKRLTRQLLTDTATEMFLDRGFDAVTVAEIAEECGVSQQTVFNYFPTKESLLLDRWDVTAAALRKELVDTSVSPVESALEILNDELAGLTTWMTAQDEPVRARTSIQRFAELVAATPSLRAHQRQAKDQLITVAAEALAHRAGMRPGDPEPMIVATALLGLWEIQARSLEKHLGGTGSPAQMRRAIMRDVKRAAQLLDAGLSTFRIDPSPTRTTRRANRSSPATVR